MNLISNNNNSNNNSKHINLYNNNHSIQKAYTASCIDNTISSSLNNHLLPPGYVVPVESREVFIPGFMKVNNEHNMTCLSFSILKSLLPSLNCSDICEIREACTKFSTTAANQSKNKFVEFLLMKFSLLKINCFTYQ